MRRLFMFLHYLFEKVARLSQRQITLPLKETKQNGRVGGRLIYNELVPCGGE